MRGKAWPVSELPATARPCLPETGCSRPALMVFLAALCTGLYKAVSAAQGAALSAARWDMPQHRSAA